jgi:hypothetical protein
MRTLIAIVAMLFMATAFIAPSAQACISCSYTPEVAKSPSPSAKPKAKKQQVQRKAPSRKKIVKQRRPAPKKVDTAKSAPADTQPEETTETTETAPEATDSEDSVSTAGLDGAEAAPSEEIPQGDGSGALDCKKFSPTIGTTVSVPCE